MRKDQSQRRNYQDRGNKGGCRSQRILDLPPLMAVCGAGIHRHCTARVADVVVVMVLRRSCAIRFTRMVTPKRTSPISNNAPRQMSVVASVNSLAITLASV